MSVFPSDRSKRVHYWLGIAGMWAFFAGIMLVLYWMLWPYQDVWYADGDVTIDRGAYYQSQWVTVTAPEFCNTGVDTINTRSIGNEYGALILLPIVFYAPAEKVCFNPNSVTVEIPDDVPPGTWHLEFTTSYKPNPIRTVEVTITTPNFEVVQDPEHQRRNQFPRLTR